MPLAVTRLIRLAKTCLLISMRGQLIPSRLILLRLSLKGSQTRLLTTARRVLRNVLSLLLCEHRAGLMTMCRLIPPVLLTMSDDSRVKHGTRRLGTVRLTTLARFWCRPCVDMPIAHFSLVTVPPIPLCAVREMNLQLPIMPEIAPTDMLVVPVILCTAMIRLLSFLACPGTHIFSFSSVPSEFSCFCD